MVHVVTLGLIALISTGCAARATVRNPVLDERLEKYMDLRREAVLSAGRVQLTEDPGELRDDVSELAKQIQALRRGVREGNIFGGSVGDAVRASLRTRLARDDGERLVGRILGVQPEPFAPAVNERYPGDEPRASTPTAVLRVLPRLPSELSYRFVRRDLLLLDRRTRVIVDILRDALPATSTFNLRERRSS